MPLLSFTFTAPAQGEPGRVHQPAAVAAAEQIQRCSQCVGLHLSPAHQRLGRVLRIRCGETAIPFFFSFPFVVVAKTMCNVILMFQMVNVSTPPLR